MYHFILTFVIAVLCISIVQSAKILAIFPGPGYSQYFVGEPLLLHLAQRGHEITLVSFYKPKQPVKNLISIEVNGLDKINEDLDVIELFDKNIFAIIKDAFVVYNDISTEMVLNDEKVQRLINSNETFDLILLEQVANEPLMAFAHHFQAPLVLFSTIGASEWVNHLVANPAPFSYVPHTLTKFSTQMNIWERTQNFLVHIYSLYVEYFYLLPMYEETVKKYFPNAPSVEEIMYNASIVLLNSHPAATPPYPTTANMIEIGGFHIREEETLPKNVKAFLDNSINGAIYFSMGTNVDFRKMGDKAVKEVLEVFSKLKENIVWKFADENLPGKTKNVLIRKWMQQRAILKHKNVKVFISHCGLISVLEAMYFGVPLICIPVFVDQGFNAALVTNNKVALTIHPQQLNRHTLKEALDQILTNKMFTQNAQQRSKYFKDTLIKPMDLATYWIEFVIRHKGAPHLQNPGLNLHWYEYYYLDVVFLLTVTVLTIYLLLFVIKNFLASKKKKIKSH